MDATKIQDLAQRIYENEKQQKAIGWAKFAERAQALWGEVAEEDHETYLAVKTAVQALKFSGKERV